MSFFQKLCSNNVIKSHVRTSTDTCGFSEAYHTALHAFLDRRQNPSDPGYITSYNSPDKERRDFFMSKNNGNNIIENDSNNGECDIMIPRLPNAQASEIFEIGWVPGTQDRYIGFIYAEWQNTKVCLRRHVHPDCINAVKADLEVLGEVRHPNVLLLMGTTQLDGNRIIAIYEAIDCTLFNYIHEQGERVAVQGIVKCIGNLAAALKHAHMLGYIHSAISSHCVFLSSNGIVKLGGWELATYINKPVQVRNYEERLRSEIFRWQAPELFIGQKASTATDVYGLTLIMWEMCTMNIPWNGLNITEVEKQCMQRREGIIMNLYNFPPLLNNFLEAGLQSNVTKRTLDIIKMSRFLQRLEMQYEDEEPIYIEQLTSNNKCEKPFFTPPMNILSSYNVPLTLNWRSSETTKLCSKQLSSNPITREEKTERKKELHEISPKNQRNRIKIVDKTLQTKSNINADITTNIIANKINSKSNQEMKQSKIYPNSDHKIYKIVDPTIEDDEYVNDSRLNIKKLKEYLASKRKDFLCGTSLLHDNTLAIDKTSTTSILTKIRSKDYEPHKPASHKTNFQPKQTISSTQYPTSITRTALKKNQKSPYSCVPIPIKNAVIQPQILNMDSQSFFETSLWRKEKLTCLSHTHNNLQDKSNDTFIVDGRSLYVDDSKELGEYFTPINDSSVDITVSTIPRSKSLQALKDALERATDLIRSTTPIIYTTSNIPLTKNHRESIELVNNANANIPTFEKLCIVNKEAQSQIKSIENDTKSDIFTVKTVQPNKCKNDHKLMQYKNNSGSRAMRINKLSTVFPSVMTKFHHASIVDSLNGHNLFVKKEKNNIEKLMRPTGIETTRSISRNDIACKEASTCIVSFSFNNSEIDKMKCFSRPGVYSRSGLIRRRSLPAELGQLRIGNIASLEKSPIERVYIPDATVEDLYIDDEFCEDSLAPNMILMNEGTAIDNENYFPD